MKVKTLLFLACALVSVCSYAQQADTCTVDRKHDIILKQNLYPLGFDNFNVAAYYYNAGYVYNMRNYTMCSVTGSVTDFKVNPSGTTYAVLSVKKNGNARVGMYDLWEADRRLHTFKDVIQPTAICYSPDARDFVIAKAYEICVFDARKYTFKGKITVPFSATGLCMSQNMYFLAAFAEKSLHVWNYETKEVRSRFQFDANVNCVAFSHDSKQMAVTTSDGKMYIYDTQDFTVGKVYEGQGTALSCSFHPDGKYVAVVKSTDEIDIVNLLDDNYLYQVLSPEGGVTKVSFVRSNTQVYLLHNTNYSLMFNHMIVLAPHYRKMLSEELDRCMDAWMKQLEGETEEEYNMRVTEENRLQQMRLFEQEISTAFAGDMVKMSEISLGMYNPETNMLTVNFNDMPSIYLEVPSGDLNDFMSSQDLEFSNVKYGLTADDKFEMIYAEVYNPLTKKTYIYDNLDRKSLDFLTTEEDFVPLQLVQQSNMEEIMLEQIKDSVMAIAKNASMISDHTNIAVNSKVVADVDADGNKILNYVVNVSYDVQLGFSIEEDFKPGRFKVEESGAAMSMLSIVKQAFEGDLAQYVKSGKKLKMKITGMADALKISRVIPYDGCYGEFVSEPVHVSGELGNITLTKKAGITENEQLAMLRALGVGEYVTNNIQGFSEMAVDKDYFIEVSEEEGGEFRRINLEMIFVDALR